MIFRLVSTDTRSPELVMCPENLTMVADGKLAIVSWPEPIFSDSQSSEIKVTSTFGSNAKMLSWGEHRVTYTATNTYNKRTTLCVFYVKVLGMWYTFIAGKHQQISHILLFYY